MDLDITMVKLEIYAPEDTLAPIRDALTALGACRAGQYDSVVAYQTSMGYWRPLEDSQPFQGEIGQLCHGTEVKIEALCPVPLVKEALQTIKAIHPYDVPVIHVIPLLNME